MILAHSMSIAIFTLKSNIKNNRYNFCTFWETDLPYAESMHRGPLGAFRLKGRTNLWECVPRIGRSDRLEFAGAVHLSEYDAYEDVAPTFPGSSSQASDPFWSLKSRSRYGRRA
jgi:hypothetical protein